MSYATLIIFKNGKPAERVEYRNAWGGSARIWNSLFDAYVTIWDLAKRKDLPTFERAVHAFTFDRFYVRSEHFARFAADLRAFVEKYPVNGIVDHLQAWAKWMEDNGTSEAIALYGTSVSENPWENFKTCPTCGNKTDEVEAVSLIEGTEVYDWLESK